MGSPTTVPAPAAATASKSTTPATKLATGSAIVIVVSAVGSEPLANASWTRSPPRTVDSATQYGGQSDSAPNGPRRARSSVTSTTKTAVRQKQIPAPAATNAERSWACRRSRRAAIRSSTTTSAATLATTGTSPRRAVVCGTPERTASSTTRPVQTSAVPSQSRASGHVRSRHAAIGSANSSWTTSSACTTTIDPRCRAVAWTPKPMTLTSHPASHRGSRISGRNRPSTGSQAHRGAAAAASAVATVARGAAARAAVCCSVADTANSKAASRAHATLASTMATW